MEQEYAIETKELTKQYQNKTVVNQVSLKVKKGEIYGFIGRNGAGKSTTLKMCCGLVHPSEGEVMLYGSSVKNELVRRRVGMLIESAGLYPNLSAKENMILKAKCMGSTDLDKIEDLLSILKLKDAGNKKIKAFSMGMKQRLGIAMALLGNPDLLILDEPINGLDPEGIREIRHFLRNLNQETGKTIVISSHILGELSKLATSYGIIKDGVLIQQMSREELEDKCKDYLQLRVNDITRATAVLEENLLDISYHIFEENTLHIFTKEDSGTITTLLVQHGIEVKECVLHQMDLEHYFLDLMDGGKKYA